MGITSSLPHFSANKVHLHGSEQYGPKFPRLQRFPFIENLLIAVALYYKLIFINTIKVLGRCNILSSLKALFIYSINIPNANCIPANLFEGSNFPCTLAKIPVHPKLSPDSAILILYCSI